MGKKKFLLLSPSSCTNPRSGGGQRTNLIYNILQKLGEVDVVLVGGGNLQVLSEFFPGVKSIQLVNTLNPGEIGFSKSFRKIQPQVIDNLALVLSDRAQVIYKADPLLQPVVKDLLAKNDYDLIIGRHLRTVAKAGIFNQTNVPIILDYDDPDNETLRTRLNQPGLNFFSRVILASHLKQTEKILPQLLSLPQHIWVTHQNHQNMINHPEVSILPNIPYSTMLSEPPEFIPINPDSQTILFVGIHGYRVNRDGVKNFIVNQWSNIRKVVNSAQLRIVGLGNWSELESQLGVIPGVEYVGFVEDLRKEYNQARFTIVPLFEGGGTKIKVMESLYYGRTAVVTDQVHYGYRNLPNQEALLVANTETEFTDQCIRLLNDSDLCNRLAQQGREMVIDNYSFSRFESIVTETVNSLCPD
ncbi:MAG: glycosyltransferase [Gloeocapsa sp. DLM2.Bin57]|nr:MAG: glycosyltransferase [Gloeocapsa sp. DLM2.Bin57]